MRVYGPQDIIVTSLDEGTRPSGSYRTLIARLHGHQVVILTSLLENVAGRMRLHGHQGIIVTSLGEGTRSSKVHRNLMLDEVIRSSRSRVCNLTDGKPPSLDEVTSSSRSQGK